METPAGAAKPHSAEYFGESRDFWWNRDFLELMASRWGIANVRTVLDVGCGIGHWGRTLAPVLAAGARVTGVDREPAWVEKAKQRAREIGLGDRFDYQLATLDELPFADGAFDMVTCQTVLIHVSDVRAALTEMLRVLAPGGLLVLAEPMNRATHMVHDSTMFHAPVEQVLEQLRFYLVCERGKEALGLGNNSIGAMLPAMLAEIGVDALSVYCSDKASTMLPPYSTPEQQALIRESRDWMTRDFWMWERAETLRYFLAGGGTTSEFEALWTASMRVQHALGAAMDAGTLHSAGGQVTYLISARRR